MNKALRKAVIAGNWKMNNTPEQTAALINEMKPLVAGADCDVVICAPFIDLQAALAAAEGSNIKIGAENCHWAEKGAFTGEVSAPMLKALGVPYVIIGHSERRQYFGETRNNGSHRRMAVNGVIIAAVNNLFQLEISLDISEAVRRTRKRYFIYRINSRGIKPLLLLGIISVRSVNSKTELFELLNKRHMKLSDMTSYSRNK